MKNLKKFFGSFLVMAVCALFAVSCGSPSVEDLVKDSNKDCPKKLDDVTTLKNIKLEGKDIVYNIEVSEPTASQLVITDELLDEATANYVKTWKEGKDNLSKTVIEGGYNVVYVYEGAEAGFLYEIVVENSKMK